MDNDRMIHFLMAVAGYVAELHRETRQAAGKGTNEGDHRYGDSIPWEDENFARWMGWRGPEEQEREIRNVREKSGKGEA